MTLYEQYQGLDIDLAQLGLERGDTSGGYFCTPVGAEVIGWAGVDGIHCCFVEGFGEMVFAVSPENLPGEYVHPLARSFEDFLRLILACGLDAAEQAWMWNRGEFDAFLETYPPTEGQRAVLDALAQALALAPMDDPYGYIRAVQDEFDYTALKFSEEYYELVGDPEPDTPPERPEWKVYYAGGFGRHWGHDRPGDEIPLRKTFSWGGKVWHIPAAYACGKGIVLDLCMEIDPGELGAFLERWRPWAEGERPMTPEDEERQDAENPMTVDYDPKVTVNGRELRGRSGQGSGWVPMSCRPEEFQGEYNQQDWDNLWLMEHYGLDQEKGWMFWRESFPWATKGKPKLKTLSLTLEARPRPIPGPRFTVSGPGDSVDFTNPLTGQAHTLRVAEYEAQETDMTGMPEGWDYPTHCTAMAYTLEPELPQGALMIRDAGEGDNPRPKPLEELAALDAIGGVDGPAACSIGIIGGSDGPTAIIMAHAKGATASHGPRLYSACSALRFDPPESVQWRMSFRDTQPDRMAVELLPPPAGA